MKGKIMYRQLLAYVVPLAQWNCILNEVTIGLSEFSFTVRLGLGCRVTFRTGY